MNKDVLKTKCLIIGSGPAGYTAAIYAGRANLSPILMTGMQTGGQLTTTTEVENFPGYPEGVDGNMMMEQLRQQAERFGTTIYENEITEAQLQNRPFVLKTDRNQEVHADTVIIATGATAKYLGIEDEKKYAGKGVSACATCDGFFYRKKDVAVVGGGDTACEEAMYLAGLCNKVYMIVRKPYLRASKVMKERVEKVNNIEILYEHNTLGLLGEDGVEGIKLIKRKGESDEKIYDLKIDGFFLAIGHKPNSQLFKGQVETDEVGYIKTIPGTPRTNIKGVFAAGDVMDPHYRQAVVAAGTGCMAALEAERFLAENA